MYQILATGPALPLAQPCFKICRRQVAEFLRQSPTKRFHIFIEGIPVYGLKIHIQGIARHCGGHQQTLVRKNIPSAGGNNNVFALLFVFPFRPGRPFGKLYVKSRKNNTKQHDTKTQNHYDQIAFAYTFCYVFTCLFVHFLSKPASGSIYFTFKV